MSLAARLGQSEHSFEHFGESLGSSRHAYHQHPLFEDDALIELLTHHPREKLQCFTMGDDPTRPDEWQAVCPRNVTGGRLLEAVRRGKLWINVTNVDRFDKRYKRLITEMYGEIEARCPTVTNPKLYYNTLVLASPGTQFYYHVNPEDNMLWQMRGDLKLSMLPAMDFRFVSQEHLEEIFAREASGSIPYREDFAPFVRSTDVTAGDCAWWPLSAPIRMEYQTMCVSLVTSYYCRRRHRREIVQLANRYLLRAFGVRDRSTAESGLRSKLKRILFRTLNKCMTFKKRYDFTDSYVTNLRVNLDHPQCIERTASIIAPDFCNKNSKKKAAEAA